MQAKNTEEVALFVMNYIVLDLEWNQAEFPRSGSPLLFEIIEIGAVKLDESWNIIDSFSMLVRPRLYPKLFSKIADIVHITDEELKKGKTFPYALRMFLDWCGKDAMFCTWGSMDLTELQRNITYYKLKNPFSHPLYYYDVQKLYSLDYEDGKCRRSLDAVVEQLELPANQPFHRAVNDAHYTAQVMQHLHRDRIMCYKSLDYYHIPTNQAEEVYMIFDNYSKFVSRTFSNRDEALEDKHVTSTVCFLCGANVKRKIPWFSFYSKWYYCIATCPKHGWIRGKIRLKKTAGDKIYAIKTTKIVSESEAKTIMEKRLELQEKRRLRQEALQQNALLSKIPQLPEN